MKYRTTRYEHALAILYLGLFCKEQIIIKGAEAAGSLQPAEREGLNRARDKKEIPAAVAFLILSFFLREFQGWGIF